MKYLSYLLISFLLVTEIVCRQVTTPDIVFSVTEHDFGSVYKVAGDVFYKFEFINKGTTPIVINTIESDCKCATVTWTKDSLAPGTKGFVNVQMAIREFSGNINLKFIVKFNTKNQDIMLTLAGNVFEDQTKEEFQYSVGELSFKSKHINLGYINKDKVKSKSMSVINHSDKPIKIEFDEVPGYIEITADPLLLNPDSYGNITVKYNARLINDWDYVIDRVTPIINGKKFSKSKLAITANICEDFGKLTKEQLQISPIANYSSTTILLDTIRSKNTIELKFILKNEGRSDLIIRDVNPSCGCTAVKPEKYIIPPGDSTTIDAKFNPKGLNGLFNYTITVITNDPKNYRQYLWLKGFIKTDLLK